MTAIAPGGPPPWKRKGEPAPDAGVDLRRYGGFVVGNVADLPAALRPKRREAEECDSEYSVLKY